MHSKIGVVYLTIIFFHHVHRATIIKSSQHARFSQGMIQGRTYEIEVFEVTENSHNYRPLMHPFKITFNAHTTFEEVAADIPQYSICLMEISNIINMPEDEDIKYLIGLFIALFFHYIC